MGLSLVLRRLECEFCTKAHRHNTVFAEFVVLQIQLREPCGQSAHAPGQHTGAQSWVRGWERVRARQQSRSARTCCFLPQHIGAGGGGWGGGCSAYVEHLFVSASSLPASLGMPRLRSQSVSILQSFEQSPVQMAFALARSRGEHSSSTRNRVTEPDLIMRTHSTRFQASQTP
jgi:hypothetical protein